MTARILAPALAAVLATAAPALAFHPFSHGCGSHHCAQPTVFHSVAPTTFHTVAAPVTFHTVAAPVTFHTVATPVTFHTVAPLTFHAVAPTKSATTTADCADLNQIKADLELIKEKLQIQPKATPKRTSGTGTGGMESAADEARATPRVSPRLARVDAGLDELEAIQQRTTAMQAAAGSRTAPAPGGPRMTTPAVTLR